MKVTIFAKRDWETIDAKTGEVISGIAYDCFNEKGQPMSFTSGVEHEVSNCVEYNAKEAEDLHITPKLFGGKVSWKETDKNGKMLR